MSCKTYSMILKFPEEFGVQTWGGGLKATMSAVRFAVQSPSVPSNFGGTQKY